MEIVELFIRQAQSLVAVGMVLSFDKTAAAEAAVAHPALVVHRKAASFKGGEHRLVAAGRNGEHLVPVMHRESIVHSFACVVDVLGALHADELPLQLQLGQLLVQIVAHGAGANHIYGKRLNS